MSVKPVDFLAVAATMEKGTECEVRSSISRSYYAAFHACLAWHNALKAPGSVSGTAGGKHQQLINKLKNPAREISAALRGESKRLGMKLEILRGRRVTADYVLDETISISESSTQLIQATAVLDTVTIVSP